MWQLIRRSIRINRAQILGSLIALTAAITLLTAAGAWVEAGVADPRLQGDGSQVGSIAGSFIGIASLIAGLTVASAVASGLRERRRQFALLQAVGATRGQLRRMILLETLLLFVIAAPVGAPVGTGLAWLAIPLLRGSGLIPAHYRLPAQPAAVAGAVLLMAVVAVIAAAWAARTFQRMPAADAVRASSVESPQLSTGRRVGATVVFAAGFAAAFAPVIVSGMVGVAFAAISTFLLVTGLGLIGPVLASLVARTLTRSLPPGSPLRLPLANIRGFSHRLTAVIVPFALVAALGAVQLSTNAIAAQGGREQLAAGLSGDLVGEAHGPADVAALQTLPDVTSVTVLGSMTGAVHIDQDDGMWETTTIGTLSGSDVPAIHPHVTAGSLAALHRAGTIAVSNDALLGTGANLGATVGLRADGTTQERTIVAIYSSSLGFGDYLIGQPGSTASVTSGIALVTARDGEGGAVRASAARHGIALRTASEYAAQAPVGADAQMSNVLLLALLCFGLLAAVNTLVTLIRARRGEFQLVGRIGASRRTVVGTVLVETVIAAVIAIITGTAAAVPAAVGAAAALLAHWPALPWAQLSALPAVLLISALLAALAAGTLSTTRRALTAFNS